jgi:hypothetical protein
MVGIRTGLYVLCPGVWWGWRQGVRRVRLQVERVVRGSRRNVGRARDGGWRREDRDGQGTHEHGASCLTRSGTSVLLSFEYVV